MITMSCHLKTVRTLRFSFWIMYNCSEYKLSTAKREKAWTVKARCFKLSGKTKQTFEMAVARDNRRVNDYDWRVYLKENDFSSRGNG